MSKARDLADSAQEINILDGKSFLDEDNLASDSATGIASQQSIKAYVDGITTTNITSTGALNSGSITSGFGNIDNGSSTITTTGAISGGTISGTLSGAIASTTTATTQAESDDSTKVATTAYVTDKITTLIGGAPSTLNDLNELAAAINDDANYNSTLTTALATKLPLAGGTMTGDVLYNDNVKANFGAGSDLQIYSDGTNGYIEEAGGGNLRIITNGPSVAINKGTVGGENMAVFNADGAVQLFHDNAEKLATTATGIQVTGNATFADNGKAIFGAGSDLQIYHDGSDSRIIENGAGDLYIGGASNIRFVNSAVNATYAMFTEGGKVQLNYNDSKRFETTDAGVTVTGNLAVTGTVDGRDVASDGSKLDGVASSANNYSHPNHSGEVTSSGDGAMTIANNVVDEANLKVSNSPTNGYMLTAQSGNTGGLTWAEAGSGSRVLLNRSVMNNTSSYVFTATDATKYDSYHIEFNGIVTSQTDGRFRMYISDDGGSSYLSQIRGVYTERRGTSLGGGAVNGYLEMTYKLSNLVHYYGGNASGYVKLLNPHTGNTTSPQMMGMSVYRGSNASDQVTNTYGAGSSDEDYGPSYAGGTVYDSINAFKLQMGTGNMMQGVISVFGVLK